MKNTRNFIYIERTSEGGFHTDYEGFIAKGAIEEESKKYILFFEIFNETEKYFQYCVHKGLFNRETNSYDVCLDEFRNPDFQSIKKQKKDSSLFKNFKRYKNEIFL